MIQILGLRPYSDSRTGQTRLSDAFHDKGWRVPDIYELFKNAEAYAKLVPKDQQWNIFYTVANCTEEKRQFLKQDVLPLDIDGIERGTEDKVIDVVCAELKLPKDKLGIVYSGNGVHILIGLKNPIMDASYLRVNKPYYRALCGRINQALFNAGVQGKADPVVFSEARLLRMPFTENRKEGKTTAICTLVNGILVPLDVDLFSLADLPSVDEGEHIHPKAFARLPKPDTKAVQEKCSFIKHCKDHQDSVSEPEWYAMLSIVGRLENGAKLVHEYSQGYSGYHPIATEDKLQHALEASGPRSCSNIALMHDGCKGCPFNGKITSPIQLVGEDTIRSLETGFYNIVIKNGVAQQGKPNYDDLVKYFRQQHEYITLSDTAQVLVWNGTHWEEKDKLELHAFAEDNFRPTPSHSMCMEFESKLKRTNLKDGAFIQVQDKLNFKNGVLNLDTGTIEPHNKEYGFTYTIPYDYAPTGRCDRFKSFLQEVSCGDSDLSQLIAEYMGYCLSGADPSLVQKCAVLYGDGSNGKSVILQLMRELVGAENCTSISISSFNKDNYRYQLMHKMFNVSDEAPTDAFVNSATFKAIVSGDTIEIRKLYADPIMWKCSTKLMFACNELPFNGDYSHGMFRRLLIIPFRQTFSAVKGNRDPLILSKLLAERSDIFAYCLAQFAKLKSRSYVFTEPAVSTEELEDYVSNSDLVERFVAGMCKYDAAAAAMPTETIYHLFALWCDDNHVKPMNYGSFVRRFGRKIQSRYPRVERCRPRTEEGDRLTVYKHLYINAVSAAQLGANF